MLLATKNIYPIPSDIKILSNYGPISIIVGTNLQNQIRGDHLIIEGDPQSICDWLHPKGDIWIGKGSPILQKFKLELIAKKPAEV